jgi:hypothetical protein
MQAKINWFGLAGGIATIAVVIISVYIPWWQISVGELVNASFSPVNTNAGVFGTAMTIPLLWAANLTGLLFLVSSGAVMIAYSLLPAKPYSKHLLGFAYKKPLFAVIFFVIPLIAVSLLLQSLVGIGIPLNGTSNIAIPIGLMGAGITISFLVTAGFLWPFWLAAVAAGLCLAARIYHKRLTATKETTPQPPSTESASPPPAPAETPVPPTPAPAQPAETPPPTNTASTPAA